MVKISSSLSLAARPQELPPFHLETNRSIRNRRLQETWQKMVIISIQVLSHLIVWTANKISGLWLEWSSNFSIQSRISSLSFMVEIPPADSLITNFMFLVLLLYVLLFSSTSQKKKQEPNFSINHSFNFLVHALSNLSSTYNMQRAINWLSTISLFICRPTINYDKPEAKI